MADMTLTEQKQKLLLDATFELDKLSRVLPDLVPIDDDQTHFAVKGIAGRMVRLANAVMSGLSDSSVSDEDLIQIINFGQVGHA